MTESLRFSFNVACDPEHAFELWTRKTSLWWPADHTVTAEAGLEIVFEPRVGGRIFERTRAGREEDWGEVLVWEPPRRVAYLWHLRADRADATEVEVAFTPNEDGSTRVEIDPQRLGAPRRARPGVAGAEPPRLGDALPPLHRIREPRRDRRNPWRQVTERRTARGS